MTALTTEDHLGQYYSNNNVNACAHVCLFFLIIGATRIILVVGECERSVTLLRLW